MKIKFGIVIGIIVLVAAQSFGQSCSGHVFSQNVRERHVVRSYSVARGGCSGVASYGTSCSGGIAYAPSVAIVADLPPKVAPAPPVAQKMPVGPPPVVAYVGQTCEPPVFGVRAKAAVGGIFHGIAGLLCRTKEIAVTLVAAPVRRLKAVEVHREFHLFHR